MKQLGYLLGRLHDTPEGDGNLLDNLCLYCTSENREGGSHNTNNHPILVAGGAGGALNKGVHIRSEGKGGKLMLTLLHSLGLDIQQYGAQDGQTSETVPALLS